MKQVAEELGVGYVVEGTVGKGGDRVRITAQLNDVATGSHIWAERYDRSLANVLKEYSADKVGVSCMHILLQNYLYSDDHSNKHRQLPGLSETHFGPPRIR